jgi:hypothetical protein
LTYGRIFHISSRKKLKYGRSVEGISESGTGAGEWNKADDKSGGDGSAEDVSTSSAMQNSSKTRFCEEIFGHGRSEIGRIATRLEILDSTELDVVSGGVWVGLGTMENLVDPCGGDDGFRLSPDGLSVDKHSCLKVGTTSRLG